MLLMVLLTDSTKIGDSNFCLYFYLFFNFIHAVRNQQILLYKLTPAHLRFSYKLMNRVIMCAEADSENFISIDKTVLS